MKYNLIYFDANQLEDYFFNEDYKEAYKKFLRNEVKSMFDDPTQTCFIWTGHRTSKNYLKKDCFICMDCEECTFPIQVEGINKIWIRGKNFDYEKYKDFNVINTKIVEEIADDKNKTYEYLKDLVPKSQLVWWNNDIQSDKELPDTYNFPMILKPLDELKGNGILKFVDEVDFEGWFLRNEPNKEFILQEFIECVDYVPLGIKGTHDIRLIIVNSEIVGLTVRQPKDSGWLCNVAQGSSIKVYDLEDLSKLGYFHENGIAYLWEFKDKVISKLPNDFKSAIFSIDFCNTKDGFKIFELNSCPNIRLEYKTYINKVKELLNE